MSSPIVLGAVAYDPKVVTIWEGIREFFVAQGAPMDFVLFSNYEQQVDFLDQQAQMGTDLKLYGDVCHFSEQGVERFVANIVEFLLEKGLRVPAAAW